MINANKIALIIGSVAFSMMSFAATVADTMSVTKQTLTPSTSTAGCTYLASDSYAGTQNIPTQGGAVVTDGSNNFNLNWTSGTGSTLYTPVNCTGTYKIFFTLQLQAASNNSAIKVSVCVKTHNGVVIYGACPPSSSVGYFTFDPTCNGGNYCPMRTFPFTKNVTLTAGDYVLPPIINTSAQTSLTGGEFLVIYLGP